MSDSKRLTKAALVDLVAQGAATSKKDTAAVIDALVATVAEQLGPRGPGAIVIPGLAKFTAKATPATKDREGLNPFTKQPATIKGKAASFKVRAAPVSALKEAVSAKRA